MDLQPGEGFEFRRGKGDMLLIACGALGREIVALIEANDWQHFDITCLPAKWHNTPQLITDAVEEKIRAGKAHYRKIFVLYGDCGTGGDLDRMLAREGVERIGGPHCYSFFTGNDLFASRQDDEITAFYLTDYLVRQFDKLIWQGLGLDRHPELRDMYFGNYTKLIYLAQDGSDRYKEAARNAAEKLGLEYEYRLTGYGDLDTFLRDRAAAPAEVE